MEPGSRAQAIARDTQCTRDEAGFTRVGGPTKAFHEQVHTVLVNEAKDAVGTCADGLGDVEDVSALGVISPSVKNLNITLQFGIDSCSSRMSLSGSHVSNFSQRILAVLKFCVVTAL